MSCIEVVSFMQRTAIVYTVSTIKTFFSVSNVMVSLIMIDLTVSHTVKESLSTFMALIRKCRKILILEFIITLFRLVYMKTFLL